MNVIVDDSRKIIGVDFNDIYSCRVVVQQLMIDEGVYGGGKW